MASADDLPLADESFDCVICTEVLEHCAEPQAVMNEIARVLRPNGRAFITTPFLLPLHEMRQRPIAGLEVNARRNGIARDGTPRATQARA